MAENLREKEVFRWSYMTDSQLVTRLNRITNMDKLRCFIELARECKNSYLEHLSLERLDKLSLYAAVDTSSSIDSDTTATTFPHASGYIPVKKKKPKKKKPDNIRKIIF